jgi:hypothetical protein
MFCSRITDRFNKLPSGVVVKRGRDAPRHDRATRGPGESVDHELRDKVSSPGDSVDSTTQYSSCQPPPCLFILASHLARWEGLLCERKTSRKFQYVTMKPSTRVLDEKESVQRLRLVTDAVSQKTAAVAFIRQGRRCLALTLTEDRKRRLPTASFKSNERLADGSVVFAITSRLHRSRGSCEASVKAVHVRKG